MGLARLSLVARSSLPLTLMHPTLVLPRKAKTASVDFSFRSHLEDRLFTSS